MAISVGTALGIGAGANLFGGLLGADATRDAARIAANASRFRPVSIESGIGTVGPAVDEQGNLIRGPEGALQFTQALSPEMQAVRDQLLGIGTTGLDQFQTFDPNQAAALFTQQLNQIAQPQEQQQRLALENRLFKQGILGATPGANRFEALNTAQGFAQNQRNLQGYQYGTQEQERLFQNALGGIQGATALDQLLAQQLNQAIAAGGAQTSAATNAAQFQFQAGMNRADAISGFFGNLGQGLGQLAFQPTQPAQPAFTGGVPYANAPGYSLFSQPVTSNYGYDVASNALAGNYLQ